MDIRHQYITLTPDARSDYLFHRIRELEGEHFRLAVSREELLQYRIEGTPEPESLEQDIGQTEYEQNIIERKIAHLMSLIHEQNNEHPTNQEVTDGTD